MCALNDLGGEVAQMLGSGIVHLVLYVCRFINFEFKKRSLASCRGIPIEWKHFIKVLHFNPRKDQPSPALF